MINTSALSIPEDQFDVMFKALGNRTRRAILTRLRAGPAKVTELASMFDMTLPAASKNIRVLERAGLVDRKVTGRIHTCSLAPGPLGSISGWLDEYRQYWEGTLTSLAEYAEHESDRADSRS